MQVQDDGGRVDPWSLAGDDGHAAQLGLHGGDVTGQGMDSEHFFEDLALLGDVAADVERAVAQHAVEHEALFLAHVFSIRCQKAQQGPGLMRDCRRSVAPRSGRPRKDFGGWPHK